MVETILTIILLSIPLLWILYALTHYRELEEKRKKRRAEYLKKTYDPADHIARVDYLGAFEAERRGGLKNIMLGGLVAGPTGAALGSFLLSDIKVKHQFAVTYGDGHVEIKAYAESHSECKRLMNMAERMKE